MTTTTHLLVEPDNYNPVEYEYQDWGIAVKIRKLIDLKEQNSIVVSKAAARRHWRKMVDQGYKHARSNI